ncbi:late embryogenesis abundant protein, group 2 [Actinidia rufa]|uniref:Late embryogenesis abundant protein, group 2 n=1 Tax=Actinidia rufa TaxID=165716 RepID=A0A7J0DJC3_9ERIC|nr:late embryogenesis abundant protein, group 2 [Actinidia rufa]
MPYSAPQVPPPVPQHAQYQPPHRRNEDHETRTKITNLEQSFMNCEKHMGKVNSILESLVISQQMQGRFPAQPQQNPKPANYIEETHEQVQAITTLRSGKEIDKTIAPKRVIQGGEKSKELGVESERHMLEEERKESKGKEYEHDSEPVTKVPNEITVEDLKHAPFPQRLAKELCTVKRNLHVKETAMMNESQSAILQCKIVPKYKDPGCPTISCIIGGCKIDRALLDLGSSVNLLPYSIYKDLGLGELKPTRVTLELADRSVKVPRGIIEDVLIQVDTVYYPVDFIVLDTQPVDVESFKCHIPVILGRPFLATANVVIHCGHGLLKLSFGNMTLETNIFTVGKQMKEVDQIEEINVIESIIQEHVDREFMEDSIERALVWSELHDQLESESVSLRDASIVGKEGVIENLGKMEHGSPTKRSKSKGKAGVDYDASRFTGKNAENLFNKFKAESVLTLCQEFMANIKHESETEQGKEKLCSWVRGKKIKVTPDTFADIFEIPREENPEFAFPNVGMPDLAVVSQELLLEGDEWDGEVQCNKTRLKDKYLILFLFSCHSLLPLKRTVSMNVARARLLWAISTGKTIDLPRTMFLSLCSIYKASDKRGSVPFTGFLTELFKRSGVHIPLDFIRIEPKGPIDRASLSRSEGQRKKRKLDEEAQEGSAIGMGGLKEAILNLGKEMSKQMAEFREEVNTRLSSLEKESSRHTVMLQDMKGMLIRMEEEDDDDDEED